MDGSGLPGLAERLEGEEKEFWLHMEADSPFEKYPGAHHQSRMLLCK